MIGLFEKGQLGTEFFHTVLLSLSEMVNTLKPKMINLFVVTSG